MRRPCISRGRLAFLESWRPPRILRPLQARAGPLRQSSAAQYRRSVRGRFFRFRVQVPKEAGRCRSRFASRLARATSRFPWPHLRDFWPRLDGATRAQCCARLRDLSPPASAIATASPGTTEMFLRARSKAPREASRRMSLQRRLFRFRAPEKPGGGKTDCRRMTACLASGVARGLPCPCRRSSCPRAAKRR